MRKLLLAQFAEPEAMVAAAREIDRNGCRLIDAFSPFPVEEITALLGLARSRLRVIMFVGGALVATVAYAVEAYSAIIGYPIDSGGRPLNSWPAFMLFPFAIGIFGAALTGFVALLIETRLPALHHPLFALNAFGRATQDGFFLALEAPPHALERTRALLHDAGAVDIAELEA